MVLDYYLAAILPLYSCVLPPLVTIIKEPSPNLTLPPCSLFQSRHDFYCMRIRLPPLTSTINNEMPVTQSLS